MNDAQHIERVYGNDYFSHGTSGYHDYLSEERLLIHRGRWYARQMARHCKPGAVLDVGAAAGFTLRGFADAGWQVRGIEPNSQMAEHARSQLKIAVEQGSLESWIAGCSFDLVSMLQVIPHFVDPLQAAKKAASLIRPGGYLLVETWDRNSWTARLFGKSWHEYNPPSVLHWFSKEGLARLMANAGLSVVANGRPSKWIDGAHAKAVLRIKAAESIFNRVLAGMAGLVPDRVPIPYPAEDLFWALFRRPITVTHSRTPA